MYSHLVVFLHLLSAFIWVGGMITIRLAVHPALQRIDDHAIKLGKTLDITGRLFNIVAPFVVILLFTGLMMAIASDGHKGDLKSLFLFKEIIWTVMSVNFVYMYINRTVAWRLFNSGDIDGAKKKIKFIPNLLLPVNITLGITALYLGVSLRGL